MRVRKQSEKEAFDRLPVHLQQVVLIVSGIVQRIAAKRLDNNGNDALSNVVPTTNGENNEDRQRDINQASN